VDGFYHVVQCMQVLYIVVVVLCLCISILHLCVWLWHLWFVSKQCWTDSADLWNNGCLVMPWIRIRVIPCNDVTFPLTLDIYNVKSASFFVIFVKKWMTFETYYTAVSSICTAITSWQLWSVCNIVFASNHPGWPLATTNPSLQVLCKKLFLLFFRL